MAKATPPSKDLPQQLPKLRVPAHGRGALRVGGSNGGAGGRPASAIRASMRESLDKRLVIAEQIADDKEAAPSERMKALELLARYGLGTSDTVNHKRPTFASDDERRQRLRELLERLEGN